MSADTIDQIFIGNHKDSIIGEYDYSNAIRVIKKVVSSGILNLVKGDTIIGCNGGGALDSLIFDVASPTGIFNKLIVTDTFGIIVKILNDSVLISDEIQLAKCQVRNISYDIIDNLGEGVQINELIGCYELSNSITLLKTLINGGDIWLWDERTKITICVGDGSSDAFTPLIDNELGSEGKWIVADIDGTILAVITFNTFNLEGIDPGHCQIFHISYQGNIDNLSAGNTLEELNGCFDLSNPIDVIRLAGETEVDSIQLLSSSTICSGDGIQDTAEVTLPSFIGDSLKYLVIDSEGFILMISDSTKFDLENISKDDSLTIYAIAYLKGLDRLEVGIQLDKIEGCFSLSNPIPLDIDVVNGGNILSKDSTNIVTICSGDQIPDSTHFILSDTCGLLYTYIIYDANGQILKLFNSDTIDLDIGSTDTTFLVLIASSDSLSGFDTIQNIDVCHDKSNVITILNSSGEVFADSIDLQSPFISCLTPGNTDTLFLNSSNGFGQVFRYIITDLNDSIISISDTDTIDLSLLGLNQYKLYNFAGANHISGLELGSSIDKIVGCHDLSIPVLISIQEVNGGILYIDSLQSDIVCLGNDGEEQILMVVDSAVGETHFYVITDSTGLIINATMNPLLNIDQYEMDSLLIWSLMYNGSLEGLIKDSLIFNLSGCFDLSDPVLILPNVVNGGQIAFEDSLEIFTFCSALDTGLIDIILKGNRGEVTSLAIANIEGEFFHLQDSLRVKPSDFLEEELIIVLYSGIDSFYIEEGIVKSNDDCFTASNFIRLINKFPLGGDLFVQDSLKDSVICIKPEEELFIDFNLNNQRGGLIQYLITDFDGDTILVSDTSGVSTQDLPSDSFYVKAIVYFDSLTYEEAGSCYACSDSIQLIVQRVNGGNLMYSDSTVEKVACIGEPIRTILNNELGNSFTYLLLDRDSVVIDYGIDLDSINFFNRDTGIYLITHLSAIDLIIDSTLIGHHLDSFSNCAHLSNVLRLTLDEGLAQQLDLSLLASEIKCDSTISASYSFSYPDSSTNEVYYLVVDTSGIVIQISDTSEFNINYDQPYKIYLINFKTPPIPFGIGEELNNYRGCYGLSNSIQLPPIFNDGGTIEFEDGTLERDFCGVGISIDTVNLKLEHRGHVNRIWIATSTSGEIIDTFNQLPLLIDNNGPDSCFIYHMAFFDDFTSPRLEQSIDSLEGCFDLSNPVLITKSLIRGGEIFANEGKEVTICTGDQTIDQVDIDISFASGDGSAWLISNVQGFITSLSTVAPNNFNNLPEGTCFLRHIRYQPGNIGGLSLGVSIEDISGCFELSDSIQINKIVVDGGQLMVKDSLTELLACVDDGEFENIVPTITNNQGDSLRWFITNNFGEIIDLDVLPPYNFEGEEVGQCFIWTLSHSGPIDGFEIGNLISDIEGCFATSNPIRVRKRAGLDCLTSNEHVEWANSFQLFPNPTSGKVTIQNGSNLYGNLEVINAQGRSLLNTELSSGTFQDISIKGLQKGFYFIKIHVKNKSYMYPIIKL